MKRLNKIEDWAILPKGGIVLPEHKDRLVRIEVNVAGKATLEVDTIGGSYLLGQVEGRETIEFRVRGPAEVTAKGDKTWFVCSEATRRDYTLGDGETFTKVVERAPRNPQLELMMAKMNQSVDRRMKAMEMDTNARISKAEARAALAERARHEAEERTAARNAGAENAVGTADAAGNVPAEPADGA